jgi:ferrous iron transport protein A
MKLSEIKKGMMVNVCSFKCGHGLKHRLCTLGILKGQTIEIMKNDEHGPILVKVLDSKIAIGRGQAARIEVELCNGSNHR